MKRALTTAPDAVRSLADRCVVHVKKRLKFELDYQYETLGVLDHFITAVADDEAGEAPFSPGDPRRAQLIHLMAPTVGAYFGEVLRRRFSCRWRVVSDQARDWMMEFEEVVLRFNPIGAAAEAFALQPIDSWGGSICTAPSDAQALAERLAASPPVLESDFYNLTTRWEVVEIAEDWLRGYYLSKPDQSKTYFSTADYDDILNVETS